MAQTNDVIQITTKAILQGQEVLNVWFYLLNIGGDGGAPLEEIVQPWFIQLDNKVIKYLSTALVFESVSVKNLTNGLEIYEGSVTASGDVTGDVLPAFNTLSVKLNRQTSVTRNGRKSFAGVAESAQTNGNVEGATILASDIEDFCGSVITVIPVSNAPDETFMNPVIVGRTLDIDGVYQLDLTKVNNITGAILNPKIRTQNTRK